MKAKKINAIFVGSLYGEDIYVTKEDYEKMNDDIKELLSNGYSTTRVDKANLPDTCYRCLADIEYDNNGFAKFSGGIRPRRKSFFPWF